ENEKKVSALFTELNQLKEQRQNSSIVKDTDLEYQKKRFDALSKDYDQQVAKIKQTYENQHQIDLEKLEKEKNSYMHQLSTEQTMHENFKKEQELVIANLKSQIALMEESASSSHAPLERRYRDEIRQLQSGSDDTAQAWLEKTRAAQQQVDKLHDELLRKEITHKETVEKLVEKHTLEIDQLTETCEKREAEIEEHSVHIDDLLFQVETLQNSLEAATVRLEHTAKSTPTTSSNRDDINSDTPHEPIKNIHQECLNRIDVKQKEVQDIKNKMKEMKNVQEIELNRLRQENAATVAELRQTISSLEQKLSTAATATESSSFSSPPMDEERLIAIAEQHRKEITTMHEQYQFVVDTKDRELEDYAYRVKALVASKQKEVEKLHIETNTALDQYERNIEGYEKKMKEYQTKYQKLEDNVTHWQTISHNNEVLIEDMKRECSSHRDENTQLIRLVNQLQSELHS
ncbi:hypothetical protein BD770DRAFT_451563, partial [Pilaira anomala]